MSFPDLLRQYSPIPLADAQVETLNRHYQLLLRWNAVINLTTIRGVKEIVLRHYCESLFVAQHLPKEPLTIADIGSGAGFPGFPVAIARPDCRVTLIESHRRKAVFLKEASRGIPNISVLSQRAEDVQLHFDWIVSRAVRSEDVLGFKLASNYAILVGDEREGIPIPWGRNRYLLMGST
jgi:16S rRNA (guanine527-N7)-methyltransferase